MCFVSEDASLAEIILHTSICHLAYIQRVPDGPNRVSLPTFPRIEQEESREHVVLERLLVSNCPDPVQAGILSRSDTLELFGV
jgi:hypothetical protein